MNFQWDERNLRHVLVDRPHGINPVLLEEIAGLSPKLFPIRPALNRSGSNLMIDRDENGRFWTVVLLEVDDYTWRPITGCPSTSTEIRLYNEAPDEQEP